MKKLEFESLASIKGGLDVGTGAGILCGLTTILYFTPLIVAAYVGRGACLATLPFLLGT